jgi:hypothetical protein
MCRQPATGAALPIEVAARRTPHPLVCGERIFYVMYYNIYQLVTLVWPVAAALCFLSVLVPWTMALGRQ